MHKRIQTRTTLRSLGVLALSIALLAPMGVVHASSSSRSGFSCAPSSVTVTPLHSPVFYIDPKLGYDSGWVGYRIDAVGVQASITSLQNSRLEIQSANTAPSVSPSGAYSTVYAFLSDTGKKNGNLSHQITVSANGATVAICTYSFASVVESAATDSSTINNYTAANVSYGSSAPVIYSGDQDNLVSVSVSGSAGFLDQNSLLSLSPTPKRTWDNAIEVQLVSVRWRMGSNPQMYRDQLWMPIIDPANPTYFVEYVFKVSVQSASAWQFQPIVNVQDAIGATHSQVSSATQFSVIDRPNTDIYAALGHSLTSVFSVSGGMPPYTWRLSQGTLPIGLTLSSNGIISGTPTSNQTASVVLSVTSQSSSKTTNFPVTIFIKDSAITSDIPATGFVNKFFGNINLNGAGLGNKYAWKVSGDLPPGLSLTKGKITGTPEREGTYTFTVQVAGDSDRAQLDKNGKKIGVIQTASDRRYTVKILKPRSQNKPQATVSLIDLQLGGGLSQGLVNSATGTNFGYVTFFKNRNDCSTNTFASSSNISPTPNNGQILEKVNVGASSSNSPYQVDFTNGFCFQPDIYLTAPSSSDKVSASNVYLNIWFETGDGTRINSTIAGNISYAKDGKLQEAKNTTCTNVTSGSTLTICLGDLGFTNYGASAAAGLKKSLKFPLSFDRGIKGALRAHLEVSSDSLESDEIGSELGTNNQSTFWIAPIPSSAIYFNALASTGSAITSNVHLAPNSSGSGFTAVTCISDAPFSSSENTALPEVSCYVASQVGQSKTLMAASASQPNDLAVAIPSNLATSCDYYVGSYLFDSGTNPEIPAFNSVDNATLLGVLLSADPANMGSYLASLATPECQNSSNENQSGSFEGDYGTFDFFGSNYFNGSSYGNGKYEIFGAQVEQVEDDKFINAAASITNPEEFAPTPIRRVLALPPYKLIDGCGNFGFCTLSEIAAAEKIYPTYRGNQGRISTTSGLILLPLGIPTGWSLAIPSASVAEFADKVSLSKNSQGDGIIVKPVNGFTGFLHIPLLAIAPITASLKSAERSSVANATTSSISGLSFAVDLEIYPEPVRNSTLKNLVGNKTIISWSGSSTPSITNYQVFINGNKVCETLKTSCVLDQLYGPNASVFVFAKGGMSTRSVGTKSLFTAESYVPLLRTQFAAGKSKLTTAQLKNVTASIDFLKQEGYTKIYVVAYPGSAKVNALAKARIQTLIGLYSQKLKGRTISGTNNYKSVADLLGLGKTKIDLKKLPNTIDIYVR